MKNKKFELASVITLATQKYYEHSTMTRAGRRARNQGVFHADSTYNRSIIHVGSCLEPLRKAMFDIVKAGEIIHADETPIRVRRQGEARKKGRGRCDTYYMYALLRDERKWNPEAAPVVVFHARSSRSAETIRDLLTGTAIRYVHIDGYKGYNILFKADGQNDVMSPSRCWAHTRRKFEEIKGSPLASRFVALIKKMYDVENAAEFLTFEERAVKRQKHSLPVLDEIETLPRQAEEKAEGTLKLAITYTLNGLEGLTRFIFDGRLESDNNPVEQCIRGIALTRKNSLYAGSPESAETWAIYFTLIETAKLNGVDPHAYLQWAAGEIERTRGEIDYSTLMPWHCPVGRILP